MKKLMLVFLFFSLFIKSNAETKRVLFIGNSYIYTNNLPQVLKDVALSNGDDLIFDSSAPGGHTFLQHTTNATTLAKIQQGNWDYIILQEQSQRPAFPISQVETEVFPYAAYLDSISKAQNTCATVLYYMTWGRKNGDASNCQFYPPLCTYGGMDSLLRLRYQMMADENSSELSPVGAVWKNIRINNPTVELYVADESHPNPTGTYAAAVCFYSSIFRKSPLNVTYNFSVSAENASIIKSAVYDVVFQNFQQWNIGNFDPHSAFEFSGGLASGEFVFSNLSEYSNEYIWDFGDGTEISTEESPSHVFAEQGNYYVKLISKKCGRSDTLIQNLNYFILSGISNLYDEEPKFFPNPGNGIIEIIGTSDFGKLIVTTMDGRTIKEINSMSKNIKIDLSENKSGIYFVSFIGRNGNKTYRYLKV